MRDLPINEVATIYEGYHCTNCGWSIIFACCNESFQNFKNAKDYDWWLYCSNKGCENHDGEGIFTSKPTWVSENIKPITTEVQSNILQYSKAFDEMEGMREYDFPIHKENITEMEFFVKGNTIIKFGNWIFTKCETCEDIEGKDYVRASIKPFSSIEKVKVTSNFIKVIY